MVDSVLKGYEMLALILSYCPLPIKAFFFMSLGWLAVRGFVHLTIFLVDSWGGGK